MEKYVTPKEELEAQYANEEMKYEDVFPFPF
jgi:hypothetical protein